MSTSTIREGALSKRLLYAILVPVLLLVAAAGVVGVLIERMADDARWLDHSDRVRGQIHAVMEDMVNQETGLRGFLLTNDRRFLEPFDLAHPRERLDQVRDLVADNPGQQARVELVRSRYERWLAASSAITNDADLTEARTSTAMLERKRLMDSVRAAVADALRVEDDIRASREATSANQSQIARGALLGLLAVMAIVLTGGSRQQIRTITRTYEEALTREADARRETEDELWIRGGLATLSQSMQGDLDSETLGERLMNALAPRLDASAGAFFVRDPAKGWRRAGGFALDASAPRSFEQDEGLVGRAARHAEPLLTLEVPPSYLRIRSGTGEGKPQRVALVPARIGDATYAVVELGFMGPLSERASELLRRIGEPVATAVRSAEHQERMRELLAESQQQNEELQTQQEELRVTNEELEERGDALRTTQLQLEERKEELETANAYLSSQKRQLEVAQALSEEKAEEVERASRFKSEFLANMSHELRTPLNSTLILAKLLAENKEGNLTAGQVKFAQTIYSAGNDLLALISDVLDLSKIEAGKLDTPMGDVPVVRVVDGLARMFEPIAQERGLAFWHRIDANVPETIETNAQRLEQILKNLLANAFKFTDAGEVSLRVVSEGDRVRFEVRDTGPGIPADQREIIFDAFRQGDAGMRRKHGGTGLGLSISRDLASLLGGEVRVDSEVGRGSVFTLVLNRRPSTATATATASAHAVARIEPPRAASAKTPSRDSAAMPLDDDRDRVDRRNRLVLVIDDDLAFAQILMDLAHEQGFQCLVAADAESGFALARAHVPDAVLLDVSLPDHTGLSVLDRMKRNAALRHVPVHVVSAEDNGRAALAMGAVGYLQKPVLRAQLEDAFRSLGERLQRRVRRLLVVEDDTVQRDGIGALLAGEDIEIVAVGTVSDAIAKLAAGTFDCIVTDLALPDATGFDLLDRMARDEALSFPPVIVYTGRALDIVEEQRLRRYSSSIIVKGARSPERLLDEVTLFLHRVESELPPERQRMLSLARDREAIFEGRQIMIVEDDVRNVFALSSILESKGASVVIARNGREALAVLADAPGVELVLMDVMMPEMDGLQATREIRRRPEWARLPIIALTAKAMSDDRERCIQAGANDYLAKPLDTEVLLSLLRVWLPR